MNEVFDIIQTRKIRRLPVIGNLTSGLILLGLITLVKTAVLSEEIENVYK